MARAKKREYSERASRDFTVRLASADNAKSKSRGLFWSLIVLGAAFAGLVAFAPVLGDRKLYSDIIALVMAGAAFAISLQIVRRQKLKGTFPQLFAFLAIGLGLWLAAELIWAYNEQIAKINTPFPSVADAFWLTGHVPFLSFVSGIFKSLFTGDHRRLSLELAAIAAVGVGLIAFPLWSIHEQSDLRSFGGTLKFVTAILYPILDVFLLVPTAAVFIRMRKGRFTFTPWAYLVAAIVLFITGDIGFAIFTAKGGMDDMLWIWKPLYNVAYMAIACSLFWHREFFTIDEKKMWRAWQEANR